MKESSDASAMNGFAALLLLRHCLLLALLF